MKQIFCDAYILCMYKQSFEDSVCCNPMCQCFKYHFRDNKGTIKSHVVYLEVFLYFMCKWLIY